MNEIEKLLKKVEHRLDTTTDIPLKLTRQEIVIIRNALKIYVAVEDALEKSYQEATRYI